MAKRKRQITCPLCNGVTRINNGGIEGLPDDFKTKEIVEFASSCNNNTTAIASNNTVKCGSCQKENTPVKKCLNCAANICEECVVMHKTVAILKSHKIEALKSGFFCEQHSQEGKYFCRQCLAVACITCIGRCHKNHADIVTIDEELEQSQVKAKNAIKLADKLSTVKLNTVALAETKAIYEEIKTTNTSLLEYVSKEIDKIDTYFQAGLKMSEEAKDIRAAVKILEKTQKTNSYFLELHNASEKLSDCWKILPNLHVAELRELLNRSNDLFLKLEEKFQQL